MAASHNPVNRPRSSRRPPPVPNLHAPVEKLLYSRKDAAYALSVSLRSVDTMISNKILTTRRFGGRVLIPAQDVRRVVQRVMRCDMLEGSAARPFAEKGPDHAQDQGSL